MTELSSKEYMREMIDKTPQLKEYGFTLHIEWNEWAEINEMDRWDDGHQELLYEHVKEIAKSDWDPLYQNSTVILFKDLNDILAIKLALGGKWITGIVNWHDQEIIHTV